MKRRSLPILAVTILALLLLAVTTLEKRTPTELGSAVTAPVEAVAESVAETVSTTRAKMNARQSVRAAWERVIDLGAYDFSADVIQRSVPVVSVVNVGRRVSEDRFYLEGGTNLPEATLELKLWQGGGSVQSGEGAIEVLVEDGRTRARRGGGEWEEIEDFTGSFAPDQDFLAYLVAAQGIEEVAAGDGDDVAEVSTQIRRFSFEIDGPTFARYMRDRIAAGMHARGEMPSRMQLDLPVQYVEMTGHGELWVGANGYPLRQKLDLAFPSDDVNVARVDAQIDITFSDFPAGAVASVDTSASSASTGAAVADAVASSLTTDAFYQSVQTMLGILLLLVLIVLFVIHRRSHKVYQVISLAVLFSMVGAPLLENHQVAAFYDRQHERAASQEAARSEQSERTELLEALNEPRSGPGAAAKLALVRSDSGADLDRDGMTDVEETILRTDPLNAQPGYSPRYLRMSADEDMDGDGLNDYEEALIGTSEMLVDTDGDLVDDLAEIEGFTYQGVHYTTDPANPDTNRDGIGDGIEWMIDGTYDLDGDGEPNIFDFDNDGDGVVDSLDLSPSTNETIVYSDDAPLQVVHATTDPDSVTYFEFQIRPENPERLWYAQNVLDWPGTNRGELQDVDSEGQIRDVDGATFYDVCMSNPSAYGGCNMSPDANGDIKLIPMLEIRVHRGHLPADLSLLDRYGIQTHRTGTQLSAFVPLELVIDEKSGERQAFYGKMVYEIGTSRMLQNVRLVWAVQMLLDICQEHNENGECVNEDLNVPQVIHSYADEWRLTGLNITENAGTDVATIFEDPTVDAELESDDQLYLLINGLDRTFIAGRDCDTLDGSGTCVGDGQLDINVAEIERRFDRTNNGEVGQAERWGLENLFRVERSTYRHLDEALLTTVQTTTEQILSTNFAGRQIEPALLFARSQRYRSLNLDLLGQDSRVEALSRTIRINFNESGGTPLQQHTSLNVSAYRENLQNQTWESLGLEEGWERLARLNPDASQRDLTLVQVLFTRLYTGHGRLVQLGAELFQSDPQTEAQLEAIGTQASIVGRQRSPFLVANRMILEDAFPDFFGSDSSGSFQVDDILDDDFIVTQETRGRSMIDVDSLADGVSAGLRSVSTLLIATGELTGVNQLTQSGNVLLVATVLAFDVLQPIVSTVKAIRASMSLFSSASSATFAGIGLVVGIGISWGAFAWQVAGAGIAFGTGEFDRLLLSTLVSTFLSVVLFALSLIPFGSILTGLISLFDAITTALCSFDVEDACDISITGIIAGAIVDLFHSGSLVVDVDAPDLINMGSFDMQQLEPSVGLVAGAQVRYETDVGTNLRFENLLRAGIPMPRYRYSINYLRQGTVRHRLSAETNGERVYAGQMAREWAQIGTVNPAFLQAVQDVEIDITLRAGVNAVPPVYLNSDYALPGYSETIYPFYAAERLFTQAGSISQEVGSLLILDVLPATLDEFWDVQTWAPEFRVQDDPDGDGLISAIHGGSDPGDGSWDGDGDGLGDRVELELRARGRRSGGYAVSANNSHSDGDTLSDLEEIRAGSDPTRRDGDGDGLFDEDEVNGYLMTLPSGRQVRVFSDPMAADGDGDGMSDGVERALQNLDPIEYPFHPRVRNQAPLGLFSELSDEDGFVAVGDNVTLTARLLNTINSPTHFTEGDLVVDFPARLGGGQEIAAFSLGANEEFVHEYQRTVTSGGSEKASIGLDADSRLRQNIEQPEWAFIPDDARLDSTTQSPPRLVNLVVNPNTSFRPIHDFLITYVTGTGTDTQLHIQSLGEFQSNGDSTVIPTFNQADRFDNNQAPVAACNTNHSCLVVWAQRNGPENRSQIWGAVVLRANVPEESSVSNPFQLSANDPLDDQAYPSVAAADNRFVVAWSGKPFAAIPRRFHMREVTASEEFPSQGLPDVIVHLGQTTFLNPNNAYIDVERTAVAPGPSDDANVPPMSGWAIAWDEVGSGRRTVYANLVQGEPNNLRPISSVNHLIAEGTDVRNPDIVYDHSQEEYVVAYLQNHSTVKARRGNDSGAIGSSVTVATSAADQGRPIYNTQPHVGLINVQSGQADHSYMVGWEGDCSSDSCLFGSYTNVRALGLDLSLRGPLYSIAWDIPVPIRHIGFACGEGYCASTNAWSGRIFFSSFLHDQPNPPLGSIVLDESERLTVDADDPVVTFAMGQHALQPGASQVIGGEASDPSSYIESVRVRIDGGAWQAAEGAESWAFLWTSPSTPGPHTIEIEATDAVGRRGSTTVNVEVDGAAPTISLNEVPGGIYLPSRDEEGIWKIGLSGEITDSAGIAEATLDVVPGPGGPQAISGGAWQAETPIWNLSSDDPAISGTYSVTVRASDQAIPGGNISSLQSTILVDGRAPEATLDAGTPPIISTNLEISGRMTDTGPVAAGVESLALGLIPLYLVDDMEQPALLLHLDDAAGSRSFHDASPNEFSGVCSGGSCPTTVDGQVGAALHFDGQDDYLAVGNPDPLNIEGEITLAAWIRPEVTNGLRNIVAHGFSYAPDAEVVLRINNDSYQIGSWDGSGHTASAPVPAGDVGNWVHLAGTYDGTTWRLYRNGDEIAATVDPVGAVPVNGDWLVGASWHNGGTVDRFFQGDIDEVHIYGQALNEEVIRTLYESWRPAVVDQPGSGIESSPWRYTVGDELEGYYQFDLRTSDVLGNYSTHRGEWPIWQGEIDSRAPTIDLTASHHGTGAGAFTRYSAEVYDLNLDQNGLTFLCAEQPEDRHYLQEPWWQEISGGYERLVRLTPTCDLPGHLTEPVTIEACDIFGHCAQATATNPTPATSESRSTVFSPAHGDALTTLDPVTIRGGASSSVRIIDLELRIDGAELGTVTFPANTNDSEWELAWTPPSEGVYHFAAELVDEFTIGPILNRQTHEVVVDLTPPAISIDTTPITSTRMINNDQLTFDGTATDAVGLHSVWTGVDAPAEREAVLDDVTGDWRGYWITSDSTASLDGGIHTVNASVEDLAGRTAQTSADVIIDIVEPTPMEVQIQLTDGTPIEALETIDVQTPDMRIEWSAPADGGGILGVWAGWTQIESAELHELNRYGAGAGTHHQLQGEAQILYAHVKAVDNYGNIRTQSYGPFYFDRPATPSLVDNLNYDAWTESGAAQIGQDSRLLRNMMGRAQSLYAGWDADTLRLQWRGASWEGEGDLFLYLDSVAGGTSSAYNPFDDANTVELPPGFTADYMVRIVSSTEARLYRWDGSWSVVELLSPDQFQVHNRRSDIILPFASLNIGTPAEGSLRILGLATEDTRFRVWSTIPAQNPANSPRVLNFMVDSESVPNLQMLRFITLSSLAPGILPIQGVWRGDDVLSELREMDEVAQRSYLAGGYFHLLQPGTPLDPELDGIVPDELADTFPSRQVGTGDVISYTLRYSNEGTETAIGLRLDVTTFGPLRINGGTSATINLPSVEPGTEQSVEFSVSVVDGPAFGELNAVLQDPLRGPIEWFWSLQAVDREAPTDVALMAPVVIGRHNWLAGTASDASTVSSVELEITLHPGGSVLNQLCPQDEDGQGRWSCMWDAPDLTNVDSMSFRVRATDRYGHVSPWSAPTAPIPADITAPEIGLTNDGEAALVDGVLSSQETSLTGFMVDDTYTGSVHYCLTRAEEENCGQPAVIGTEVMTGSWMIMVPTGAKDHITATLILEGEDLAQNRTTVISRSFYLDTVPPQVEVTTETPTIDLATYWAGEMPLMQGNISDGSGLPILYIGIEGTDELPAMVMAEVFSDTWTFRPLIREAGRYTFTLEGWDQPGNAVAAGQYVVEATGVAPAIPLDFVWDGGGDGMNLTDPANWMPDGLPTALDRIILNDPNPASLNLSSSLTIGELLLTTQFGGSLDLSSANLLVLGHLRHEGGTLNLGDGRLEVGGDFISDGGQFDGGTGRLILTAEQEQTLQATSLGSVHVGTGPIAHWKLDEGSGTTLRDSSGYGQTAITQGGPTWSSGAGRVFKNQGALDFDGNDYAIIEAGSPIAHLQNDFSVMGWVYQDSSSGPQRIISSGRTAMNAGWGFGLHENGLRFTTYQIQDYDVNMTIPLGQWVHVAAVMDGDNDVTFYVNGVAAGTVGGTVPAELNLADGYRIGSATSVSGNSATNLFKGRLDDIRVYDRSLTADEIHALAGGAHPNGLAGYWPLDDGSGPTAADVSGNGLLGTLNGGPTWSSERAPTQFANAGSLSFDGVDDRVELPALSSATRFANRFSVAVWVRPNDLADRQRLVAVEPGSPDRGWGFGLRGSGLRFTTYGVKDYDTGSVTLTPNVWTHLAMTMDHNNDVTFYVNGTAVETVSGSVPANVEANRRLLLGALNLNGGESFGGLMDEARIYDRVLSATEIADLANGVELNLNGGRVTLAGPVEVKESLILNRGTLDVNASESYSITLKGDLRANGGGFLAHNGDLILNGNGAQVIDASGIVLNNVIVQNGSTGLVGQWSLDEIVGGFSPDATQYGNSGEVRGATVAEGSPAGGSSLHFDGVNDYVHLGDPGVLNVSGEIGIAAWVRPENLSGLRNIVSHGYNLNPHGEVVLRINNGSYQIGSWNGTGRTASYPVPAEDVGSWVQLVGVFDGTTWRLYRNGIEVANKTDSVGAVPVSRAWAIGARGGGGERFFQGDIDDVRIYNRGLTAVEAADLALGARSRAVGERTVNQQAAGVILASSMQVRGELMMKGGLLDSTDGANLMLEGNLMSEGGRFNARNGTVTFMGQGEQKIMLEQIGLANVAVMEGTILSTEAAVSRSGAMNNRGVVHEMRKIEAVDDPDYASSAEIDYGLSEISLDLTERGSLQSLQVTRIDQNHPAATDTTRTGKYWLMEADGEGYLADITLGHDNALGPGVCKHLDDGTWDYIQNEATDRSVTRYGERNLSGDWTVGIDPTAASHIYLPWAARSSVPASILAGIDEIEQSTDTYLPLVGGR